MRIINTHEVIINTYTFSGKFAMTARYSVLNAGDGLGTGDHRGPSVATEASSETRRRASVAGHPRRRTARGFFAPSHALAANGLARLVLPSSPKHPHRMGRLELRMYHARDI